jgi:hypothetical protein
MIKLSATLLLTLLLASTGSWADETKKPAVGRDADWLIPESPAFSVLNVTPQSVTRPGTPRELAVAILNSLDANNNPQQGIALDMVPYMLAAGDELTIADYRGGRLTRILSRSQVSLATTKGQNDADKAFRAAASVRVTLWDRGDPRLDTLLDKCFDAALSLPASPPPPPNMDTNPDVLRLMEQQRTDAMKPLAANCRKESRKRNWNRSAWDVAVAKVWINPEGSASGLSEGGTSVWSSLAYGFEADAFNKLPSLRNNAQIIGIIRTTQGEQTPVAATPGQFREQDTDYMGVRFRFGGESRVFNLEGLRIRTNSRGVDDDHYTRYTLGGDIKVSEDVWLNVSFGQNSGHAGFTDAGFVKAGLQWGLSDAPQSTAAH